jgi:ribonuclease VapC
MVIDTSALVAILQDESERRPFNEAIEAAESRLVSAATFLETSIVIEARHGSEGVRDLDLYFSKANLEIISVDAHQANAAQRAYHLYGRGRHAVSLATASRGARQNTDQTLLFRWRFFHTDITPCIAPPADRWVSLTLFSLAVTGFGGGNFTRADQPADRLIYPSHAIPSPC